MPALFWILAALTTGLVLFTFLPLWRHPAWWVRGFDFPRLQLAAAALALLVIEVVMLEFEAWPAQLVLGATAGCFVYQLLWIFPYTRLSPLEVQWAKTRSGIPRLRILSSNVLTTNRRAADLLRLIRAEDPDIVVTVETDQWWEDQLASLRESHPHGLNCPLDNLYGMHLFSRLPLENVRLQYLVEEDKPSMHGLVVLPSGERVELHCLHPAPPSPTENDTSEERDAELVMVGRAVAHVPVPVIVTGDLNDVAWSPTTRLFRKVSRLLDPRIGRGMYNTFHTHYPFCRWPLDHFFHSRHFTLLELKRLPSIGSDHFPILIELALEPEAAAEQADEGLEADADDRAEAREKTEAEGVHASDVHCPGRRVNRNAARRTKSAP